MVQRYPLKLAPPRSNYGKGRNLKELRNIGERVCSWGLQGVVVANLDTGQFSDAYPKEEWAYLSRGILVLDDQIGLIHIEDTSDPDAHFD